VVMEGGFTLTFTAVAVRTVFRLVDHLPLLWVVPLFAERYRRFGDMVAGTVVVAEERPGGGSAVREALLARNAGDAWFTFAPSVLDGLRPVDVRAVELFLERRAVLHEGHRRQLLERLLRGLVARTGCEAPPPGQEDRFLEDLLAARLRREARDLG